MEAAAMLGVAAILQRPPSEENLKEAREKAEKEYKRLALKAHPDHGGDEEQMKKLNHAIAAIRDIQLIQQPRPQPMPFRVNIRFGGFGFSTFANTTTSFTGSTGTGWW